jgi:hypothetical protein
VAKAEASLCEIGIHISPRFVFSHKMKNVNRVNTLREFKDIHPKKNPKKGEKHSTII